MASVVQIIHNSLQTIHIDHRTVSDLTQATNLYNNSAQSCKLSATVYITGWTNARQQAHFVLYIAARSVVCSRRKF